MPLDKHTWYTKIYKNTKLLDKNTKQCLFENVIEILQDVAGMNISRNRNIYQDLIINKYIKTARSDTDRTATLSLVVWKTHLTIICVKGSVALLLFLFMKTNGEVKW